MAEGYGKGGYGIIEPWGSIEYPLPGGLNRSSINTDFLGIIEALSGIIGEEDNDLGGFISSRLMETITLGTAIFPIESALNWKQTNGKIVIDGILYYYTHIIGNSLYNITYKRNGNIVSGAGKLHNKYSEVVYFNRDLTAIDKLRNSMLVDYAEGEDLKTLARNIGVDYIPLFGNDNKFREIIKNIAYNPRGTIYGIKLALDAILGSGNYELYEDLIKRPNEIFIKIVDDLLLSEDNIGKTYLSNIFYGVTSGSSNTIELEYAPLKVNCVKLKDLNEFFDFKTNIPSINTYEYYPNNGLDNAFNYEGSLSETSVSNNGRYTTFNIVSSGTAYYSMLDYMGARIEKNSIVDIESVINIPGTSILESGKLYQISFSIMDRNRKINIGVDSDYRIGLFEKEINGFIGQTYQLSTNTFYSVRIIKYKNSYIELYINNSLIAKILYSEFLTSNFNSKISFGTQGTPSSGVSFHIKHLSICIYNFNDYWGSYYVNTGSTDAAFPSAFTVSGSHTFSIYDTGKNIKIINADSENSYGGNNNGEYLISSVLSPISVSLSGINRKDGNIEVINDEYAIITSDFKFTYPYDLGKKIEIINSPLNNGVYTIIKILEEGTFNDLGDYATKKVEYSSIAILSSVLIPEINISYSILPNFLTDTSLGFYQSDTGIQNNEILTLRSSLWQNNLVMEINGSVNLSAQLLENNLIDNALQQSNPIIYSYYPFYLSYTLEDLLYFLYDFTIAGVIPRLGTF